MTNNIVKLISLLCYILLIMMILSCSMLTAYWIFHDDNVRVPSVAKHYEMIIFWGNTKPDFTAAGPFDSREACDHIAERVLNEGTSWKGWTCVDLSAEVTP